MTGAEAAALAHGLQAIADPARLRMLSIMSSRAPDPTSVTHLVAELHLAQSTVSHHLRVLADAGFVAYERVGTWSHYRVETAALTALAAHLAPSDAGIAPDGAPDGAPGTAHDPDQAPAPAPAPGHDPDPDPEPDPDAPATGR